MLQYKIPQNIGIEDKIVGPFSLRQLIIVAAGCGISYVLFAITSKLYELNILEYIIIAIPAIVAIAAALVKINNITLPKFVLLSLEFAIKPKRRMWDHRGISALVAPDLTNKQTTTDTSKKTDKKGERENVNLRDLTKVLDSGGFDNVETVKHEDIDKVKDDDLVTQAFFGHKKNKSETKNMYWRTKESQKKRLDILAKMPKTEIEKTKAKKEINIKQESKIIPKTKQSQKPQITQIKEEPVIQEQKKPEIQKEQQIQTEPTIPKKKKRRRKRKPKKEQTIRQGTQINNIKTNEPVKLIQKVESKPKQQPKKPQPQAKKEEKQITNKPKQKEAPTPEAPKTQDSGEFHISDLQKGEIEINLD